MGLPFALKRCCGPAGIDRVKCLSDFREKSFGQSYGVQIKDSALVPAASCPAKCVGVYIITDATCPVNALVDVVS